MRLKRRGQVTASPGPGPLGRSLCSRPCAQASEQLWGLRPLCTPVPGSTLGSAGRSTKHQANAPGLSGDKSWCRVYLHDTEPRQEGGEPGARRPGQTPALRKVAPAFKSASQVAGARARVAGEALTRAVRWRQDLCHISDGQEEVLRCDH